jgi:hypothetical protein
MRIRFQAYSPKLLVSSSTAYSGVIRPGIPKESDH